MRAGLVTISDCLGELFRSAFSFNEVSERWAFSAIRSTWWP
jgi:hypothetical protein